MIENGSAGSGCPRASCGGRAHLVSVVLLAGLVLAMFGDVLFVPGTRVLSEEGADLSTQFAYWRNFGFGLLRGGHLALWNPHVFSGAPFFGGFLSAMLYPLNVLYLVLPLPAAINGSIALHVFLAGALTYWWTSQRGLHPVASFAAATLLMFSGAYFSHLRAGHIDVLATAAWAPLLLLSIDKLVEGRSFAWCLAGALAVAMQLLAGHVQHFYFTAVTAAVYTAFCSVQARSYVKPALGVVAIYLGGCALSAVQLLTGLDAARESVRAGGVSYAFASTFSLAPENLLTLVAPGFFGGDTDLPYWGRYYFWEMTIFIGLTGLVLALIGAAHGDRHARRFSGCMVLFLLALALGRHTPLFRLLFSLVPGFDRFRAPAKYAFQASLFAAMLAGVGLDYLIRGGRLRWIGSLALATACLALAAGALWVRVTATDARHPNSWARALRAVSATGESFFPPQAYADPAFVRQAGLRASRSLGIAAGTLAVVSALAWSLRASRNLAWFLALLAVAEAFVWARGTRPIFDWTRLRVPALEQFFAEHPGDYRILDLADPNGAILMGVNDIWGFEISAVRRRYAEFMAFTQGGDPGEVTGYVDFTGSHRLYAMLRLAYIVLPTDRGVELRKVGDPMPRLQLLTDYVVASRRDEIFAQMSDPSFDPRRRVVLETPPDPVPVPSADPGTATVLDSSTDHLTIEANLAQPAVLLVTDSYSRGWRVTPLPGSAQSHYAVRPANYVLRAVCLSAGHHRFRMEFAPRAFQVGAWISAVSLAAYLVVLLWWLGTRALGRIDGERP